MLAALRRLRSLAVLLLAFSPGGMGTVLPVVHPCPVDMPTMAQHAGMVAPATHPALTHAADHGVPAHAPAHGASCHCPGACCPTSPVVAPSSFTLALLRAGGVARPQAPPRAWSLPTARLTHRLPPSTAPPTLV
jgi:hypothetical protein